MISSATHSSPLVGLPLRQMYAVALGLVGLLVVVSLDYRRLADRSVLLYLVALALLVAVLFMAPRVAGTRRWFLLGPLGQVQPSEFVKLAAALFVARVFAESRRESLGLSDIAGPGLAVGILAVLIAAQPDLGTAFCLVPLFLGVAFLAGLRMRAVLGL